MSRATQSSRLPSDPMANACFRRRFDSHQPDGNFDNPERRKAVLDANAPDWTSIDTPAGESMNRRGGA